MNINTEIDNIRKVSREQLIEKIKNAKNDICMIGTIAFNLPWEELSTTLCEKFKNDNFTIRILRESETTIAQYALMTLSQESDGELGSLSRGNFVGIKEKVIRELKYSLNKSNIGKNIEPSEDKYSLQLGTIYYTAKRDYIIRSYELNNCITEYKKYITKCIQETIRDVKSLFLGDFQFVAKMSAEIEKDPNLAARFAGFIEKELSDAIDLVQTYFELTDNFKKISTKDVKNGLTVFTNKNGETYINVEIHVEAEGLNLHKTVELPIDHWIDEFTMENATEEIRYRMEVDKTQAIKRATLLRKKELEKYQTNPESKQRLFIKNCYMPIPVPLIKIDNELFISMALTKFDNINKFQYVGNISFDKTSNRFVAKTGKEGYVSLWAEDFSNYYHEYFYNPNGAQKYSTEETAKGNQKEVIDIFDESRNRIGIGPRDAFLSNMSIVKSVVWALIFDRKGRILIHKRAQNAKDNQGLWDKSVGGHVSTEDLDTIEAIKREITEELFTFENEGQSGHDIVQWMITNKNKIIYLGDWKTARFPDLSALHLSPDEYYNFSLNYPDINKRDFRREIIITERLLPNGEIVKAKCFVDPYLCIVSEDFEIEKLRNSKYAMLTPNELKRCVIRKKIKLNKAREYDINDGIEEEFLPTSDLAYLVESSIWDDVVTEFARRVQETFAKKG